MNLNTTMFTEKQNYVMYELYKGLENKLESKDNLDADEQEKLLLYKANLHAIEQYSIIERNKGLRWSLVSLWQDSGMNPTLILEFYPGSDSYMLYGKNLVVNVEYSDEDLTQIFQSMREGAPRVEGILKFKKVPEFTDGSLSTADIFAIQ